MPFLHEILWCEQSYLLLKVINHPRVGHCAPVVAPVNCCRGFWQGGQSGIERNQER